jgi:S-adenosylmethionine:diacylglycerol 3-amino-3-carboxypropyl transferase
VNAAGAGAPLDSAWRAGRLDARSGPTKLMFGRVYEDSAIEERAFPSGGRIFCIASAGCTALVLCREHDVVACDINPAQVEYVRRRLAGGGLELGSAETIMRLMRRLTPLAGWSRSKLEQFLELEDPTEQLGFWQQKLDTWRFRAGLSLVLSPLWLGGSY